MQRPIEESVVKFDNDNRFYANVGILGSSFVGLLDCGAQLTVAGNKFKQIIVDLNFRTSQGSSAIVTADKTEHQIQSHVELPISFRGLNKVVRASFVPSLDEFLILGMDFWDALKVKPALCSMTCAETTKSMDVSYNHILTADQAKELENVKRTMPFSKEGELSKTHIATHTIDTDKATPIKQRHHKCRLMFRWRLIKRLIAY